MAILSDAKIVEVSVSLVVAAIGNAKLKINSVVAGKFSLDLFIIFYCTIDVIRSSRQVREVSECLQYFVKLCLILFNRAPDPNILCLISYKSCSI